VIRYWQSGDYSVNNLKHGWMPPHPTFYVRRSVYEQHGGFDTSFRNGEGQAYTFYFNSGEQR